MHLYLFLLPIHPKQGNNLLSNSGEDTGGDIGFDPLGSTTEGPPPTDFVDTAPESSDPFGLGADVS